MTRSIAVRAWFATGARYGAAVLTALAFAAAAQVAAAAAQVAAAAAQVAVPPLTARVTDQTATLTQGQVAALEQTLQAFETRKGAQIAVLIVPTTGGEAIEPFALRVAERWKLGRKNADDGALLVVAKNDRTLRIEVGYGLEGSLNDATSKRIISEIIVPRFRENDFYGGIEAGVARMMRVVDGEPLPPVRRAGASGASGAGSGGDQVQSLGEMMPALIVLTLIAGAVLRAAFGRVPGALTTGGAVALLAWWLAGALTMALLAGVIAFMFTLFGGGAGRMLGGHGGLGRGGGFGDGGGGGGFGGGGGGFGGGGASGRW